MSRGVLNETPGAPARRSFTTREASGPPAADHGAARMRMLGPLRALAFALGATGGPIFLSSCAGPFNQVTPCLLNCAVTLNGSPAVAPAVVPAPAVVEVKRPH